MLYAAKVGDRIEIAQYHRLAGETGTVVAIGDNENAVSNIYHIRLDRDARGCINGREVWLGARDFRVYEKSVEGYVPPTDIAKSLAWRD